MLDNGATHHVTNDVNSLSNPTSYIRPDGVLMWNHDKVPISLTGSTIITNNSSNVLQLNNVLHVFVMTTKLVYTYKFCKGKNAFIEIHDKFFFVKEN